MPGETLLHMIVGYWSRGIVLMGRYCLLVPELVLLLTLFCFYFITGATTWLILLAAVIAIWFGCRSSLIIAARQAFHRAHYHRATYLANLAARLYPFSADVKALQGALLMASDHTQEAAREYRRAIELYPGCAALHTAYSSVLLELDELTQARHEVAHALKIHPGYAPAYLHMAHVAQQAGDPISEVETILRAGLQAHPAPGDAAAMRCMLATLLLDQGRTGQAQLVLVGIEELMVHCPTPQIAGLHYYLGELRSMMGELDEARNHYNASEMLDPHGRFAAAAWRAARTT